MTCKCNHCEYYNEYEKHSEGLADEQKEFFSLMYEELCYTQEDLAHKKAILDGSWPRSKEILEKALKNVSENG